MAIANKKTVSTNFKGGLYRFKTLLCHFIIKKIELVIRSCTIL